MIEPVSNPCPGRSGGVVEGCLTPYGLVGLVCGAALVACCERTGAGHPARGVAELNANLARCAGFEIVVGPELFERARLAARLLGARTDLPAEVLPLGVAGDPRRARVVAGRFLAPDVRGLLEAMGAIRPAAGAEAGLEYLGRRLEGPGDAILACFEDPLRPGLPVVVLAAGCDETLARLIEDPRPPGRPLARVWSEGQPAFEVDLALDGRPAGAAAVRDLAPERRRVLRGLRQAGDDERRDAWRAADVDESLARDYLEALDRARERVRAWAGAGGAARPAHLTLVARPHDALALTGRVALSAPDGIPRRETALLCAGLPHDWGLAAARAAALELLGAPSEPWLLDGIAVDAADRWWGRPLADEAAPAVLPPLAQIVDPAAIERFSMHVLAPARGLFLRYLRSTGADVRELWAAAPERSEALEAGFRAWVATQRTRSGPAREERRAAATSPTFRKGVALGSNLRPGGGLENAGLGVSLEAARRAGADALSIATFWLDRPAPPELSGGPLPAGRESLEGDAAIALAVLAAREAGLRTVMLQPHVLLGDSSGHSVWRKRTTIADWRDFFDGYERALEHYAVLAELTGCDVLCVGSELFPRAGESEGVPRDVIEYRLRRWPELIAVARERFSGALTYGAGSGEEPPAELLGALDFVGFVYHPRLVDEDGLDLDEQAAVRRLTRELRGLCELAARHGHPALIVETGFRSTAGAGRDAALGPGELDLQRQVELLAALARAVQRVRAERDDLAGLFLWRWEADPDGGGTAERGFTPRNKPAEQVLRALFADG